MNLTKPVTWALIGALIGVMGGVSNKDSRIIGGIVGAITQAIIWFVISWVVIRVKKNYPKKIESNSNIVDFKSKKMSIKSWFAIIYIVVVILNSNIFEKTSADFSNSAGFIWWFLIFPGLSTAITGTTAVFLYRKSYSRLKNKSNKYVLAGLYVVTSWIISYLIGLLLNFLI